MTDIMPIETYCEERDKMRRVVLDALDKWASEEFSRSRGGWKDQDLSNLFPALDRHFDTCMARFDIKSEATK